MLRFTSSIQITLFQFRGGNACCASHYRFSCNCYLSLFTYFMILMIVYFTQHCTTRTCLRQISCCIWKKRSVKMAITLTSHCITLVMTDMFVTRPFIIMTCVLCWILNICWIYAEYYNLIYTEFQYVTTVCVCKYQTSNSSVAEIG